MQTGFCQKLLDKAMLLDHRVNAARVATQFGAILTEAGERRSSSLALRSVGKVSGPAAARLQRAAAWRSGCS